jgi:nucleoid-associated protein YgaU
MAYLVPNMTLIPQAKTMSCWYASAQMLIQWRRNTTQSCEMGIVDPSEDPIIAKMRDHDNGISNPALVHMAKKLGLQAVPPMSPTEGALESWLMTYGPLWVNGKTHIVVIAGIRPGEVFVYDPSPVNVGSTGWRSLAGWYVGNAVDSRDTDASVQAVFLHCPPFSAAPGVAEVDTYTVVKGDSLSKIAVKFYNDQTLWQFIYAANRKKIKNPNLIYPGQVLVIP